MAASTPAPHCTVTVFSAREYDQTSFNAELAKRPASAAALTFTFIPEALHEGNAHLAAGSTVVVPFVNDALSAAVLEKLAAGVTTALAMRCAGFNNVDQAAAARVGISVLRVPAYSPAAVAEHAVTLLLALNRHLKKGIDRGRHGNFDLSGLVGRDIASCTVGVVGTGRIGMCLARIMHGFGAKLLGFDQYPSAEAAAVGMRYVTMDEILKECDVISLHCNLTDENKHMIGAAAFEAMKPGAILINTARGGLIDTHAAIAALKSGKLGALGLDVVEEEAAVFFQYKERDVPDEIARLLLFSNVIVTGHQAFLTSEALAAIAATTIANIDAVLAARAAGTPLAPGPTVVVA